MRFKPCLYKRLIGVLPNNITQLSRSSHNKLNFYYIYIENYGFYSKTDEENSNNLISFSEDNFERRLFELIEADKKKDNLSMIYKYLEDEE